MLKKILEASNNCIRRSLRRKYSTELNLDNNGGANKTDWHSKLLYSSHLENRKEHMSYKKRKYLEQQMRKKVHNELAQINLQSAKEMIDTEPKSIKETIASHTLPRNWMNDYEFYEGGIDEAGNINSLHGTADASVLPSSVPCSGCGAHLHCANHSVPGYIPKEIFKGRTNKELKTIVCQRCHFLKHYNIALDVEVSAQTYVDTISKITQEFALAILIVDLLDFPCSIWPGMQEILGSKRPVFVVGNKVDLLPRDSDRYLEHVKQCLQEEIINCGFDALNIKYVSLISAKTGYGIEELITQLHKLWKHNGDVYLLGCTNVGKSTLFNILLNSDYCRPEATELVRKATTCPWPGTTLQMLKFPILRPTEIRVYYRFRRLFSERAQRAAEQKLRRDQLKSTGNIESAKLIGTVGRTFDGHQDTTDAFTMSSGTQPIVVLDEKKIEYQKSKWCYDTPGVMHPDQITNLLTTEELLRLSPDSMIAPHAVRFKPGSSVFLAGLARLDFLSYEGSEELDFIKIFIFICPKLPVTMVLTESADEFYCDNLGTEILGVPCGSAERLSSWPGLECKSELIEVTGCNNVLSCDILLSSVGWIGIYAPEGSVCTFKAWTPYGRGIHIRTPALVPHAKRLIGWRIRNSMAYEMAKPVFTKR